MSDVEFHAEVGFDSYISDKFPKWYDVSQYVISGGARRGRDGELDRINTGESSMLLDNPIGLFTPGRTTLTPLLERFKAFGAVGAGSTFTADSGVWQTSGGTITPGPDGVSLTATLAAGGFLSVGLGADNKAVPVVPGDVVKVTYKAKGLGSLRSAVGNTLGPSVTSDGQWITQTDTFTVPSGMTFLRPEVRLYPTVAGSASVTVAYVKVDTPHPYGGKIEPGKPVRHYLIADNNWVHYEAVNASIVDVDSPRWHSWNYADPTGVTRVNDTGLARDVFEFSNGTTTQYGWFTGLKSETDYVPVKNGQPVRMSGLVANVNTGAVGPKISVFIEHSADGLTWTGKAWSTSYTDLGIYHPADVSWTATADGYVRGGVLLQATSGAPKARAADLKLTLDGKGTSTVGAVSGKFPTFRGSTESWTQEFHGTLSTVHVECVDSLAMVAQPIDVPYRASVVAWYRANVRDTAAVDKFWYWHCAEDPGYLSSKPIIGSYPLKVIQGGANPGAQTTYGFTKTKTMPYADGDTSGGYTLHIDPTEVDPVLGSGPLYMVQQTNPSGVGLGATTMDVDLWFVADSLPPLNGTLTRDSYLFGGSHWQTSTILVDSNGALVFDFVGAFGYGATQMYKTANNTVQIGVPIHVGLRGTINVAAKTATIFCYVNGVQVLTATNSLAASFTGLPGFEQAQFGARSGAYYGSQWKYGTPMRGTLNHCVLAFDAPSGLHQSVHTSGADQNETEIARLNRILDVTSFPGPRVLDPSKSTLKPARWARDAGGQDLLFGAAEDAGGMIFVGASGEAVYHNRHRRIGVPARWTVRDWTDGLRFTLDPSRVFNVVKAERADYTHRTARDETSVKKYGARPKTIKRDVVDDEELADAASSFIGVHAVASPRSDTLKVEAHTLTSDADAPLRVLAYSAATSDRLLMTDLPPTAPSDEYDVFIEGVEMAFEIDGTIVKWVTNLTVSAADRSLAFVLDDPVSGVLDSEATSLIY